VTTTTLDAKVSEETTVLANEIEALAGRTLAIEADYVRTGPMEAAVNAAVSEEAQARATADEAEASARQALAATLRDETDTKVSAGVSEEATARSTADAALAGRISTIEASYVTPDLMEQQVNAKVQEEAQARAGADSALASRISTIEADYTTAGEVASTVNAKVAEEAQARATAVSAEASARQALEASLRTETDQKVAAGISSEAAARATAIAAEASRTNSLVASATPSAQAANRNPNFSLWNDAGTGIHDWGWWQVGGIQRVAGLSAPYAARVTANAGALGGLMQSSDMGMKPGLWIIEAVVRLNSGTFRGAGVHLHPLDTSNTAGNGEPANLSFYSDPTIDGRVVGNGVPGQLYRFSKTFHLKSTQMGGWANFHQMNHWNGLTAPGADEGGDISAANDITWYYLAVRPASAAENAGYKSLAEVNVISGALADVKGRQSAYLQQAASVGGSAAQAVIALRANINEPAASPLTMDVLRSPDVSFSNRSVRKTGGANPDWDRSFFSVERIYVNSDGKGPYVAANPTNLAHHVMFGLAEMLGGASYTNIAAGIYFDTTAVRLYRNGAHVGVLATGNKVTDRWSMEYAHSGSGGYIYVYRNDVLIWQSEDISQGRSFYAQVALYEIGSGVDNLVFGQGGPSTTSSIGLYAKELLLGNTEDGGDARVAMKIASGSVAISGNLYAGSKIILGNGEQGWEVAVKPKVFSVSDGQQISWPNCGGIPSYTFSPVGLRPLGAGQTYALSLTNLSSTGAIARLKVSVPGTPTHYNLGPGVVGGTGNPDRVITKGGAQDSANSQYFYQGTAYGSGTTKIVLDGGTKTYIANITVSATLYAKINGAWTALRTLSETYEVYGSGANQTVYASMPIAETVTIPTGVTDFGISAGSDTIFNSVQWTGAGSGTSEETASPQGQTCTVTIMP
jgi:hypothetical protein